MSGIDGLVVGLCGAAAVVAVLCLVALIAVIEILKDIKAYQFTVIDRLGTLDERLRDGNLRILKCLKGESYTGTIGGMDIHTDPSVPPGEGMMFNRAAFPGAHQETGHA